MPEGRFCISSMLPVEADTDSAQWHFGSKAMVSKKWLHFWSPGGGFINAGTWFYPRSWIYLLQGSVWASDFEKLPQVILKCSKVWELLR